MPYQSFHELFPNVSPEETRTITVVGDNVNGLPKDTYLFLELYCDEKGCDCRRVMFYVVSEHGKGVLAVIAWGWESPEFYARWMKSKNPHIIAELKGPVLNVGSPQSKYAPALLELVRNILLADPAYVERIKRHYAMFREKIDGKVRQKQKSSRKR